MLVLSRKQMESVVVGSSSGFERMLKVTVLEIHGGRVRLGFEDDADPYLRGLVATAVYRDYSVWPVVRKRAEIIARTLERLEPAILPEERIVGPAYRRFQVHRGVSDEDTWRLHALCSKRRPF